MGHNERRINIQIHMKEISVDIIIMFSKTSKNLNIAIKLALSVTELEIFVKYLFLQ